MVLVHDDDLAQIGIKCGNNVSQHHMLLVTSCSLLQALETLQPDEVENHLQDFNTEIHTDLCRKHLSVSQLL